MCPGEDSDSTMKQLLPGTPRYVPRQSLLSSHEKHCQHDEGAKKREGISSLAYVGGYEKHHSCVPLSELQSIRLAEMLVPQTHKRRYLLCRTIAPPARILGVQTVVEDQDGCAVDITIYGYPGTSIVFDSLTSVEAIFYVGATMAIREPTLHLTSASQIPILRIDSPTDIVFLKESDISGWKSSGAPAKRPTSASEWRHIADGHYMSGRYTAAEIAYSQSLLLEPYETSTLLHRAEVRLGLGHYTAALADADTAARRSVSNKPQLIKAKLQAARVLLASEHYATARVRLEEVFHLDPLSVDALQCIEGLQQREAEHNDGQYNWLKLFAETQTNPHVDAATYVGPIAVSTSSLGGRGIFATSDIQCGDLLLCSKPIASVFPTDMPPDVVQYLNTQLNMDNILADNAVLSCVVAIISGDYYQYNLVCSLYGGPSSSCYTDYPHKILREGDSINIDIASVERACSSNCFSPDPLTYGGQDGPAYSNSVDESGAPVALYALASMFNHQCFSNAWWYSLGELIIIRATRRIPQGEEVTIPYTGGESYGARHESLRKYFPSSCQCELCRLDEGEGDETLQKRDQLLELMVDMFRNRSYIRSLDRARHIVYEILETYPSSRRDIIGHKLHAGRAYHLLAQMIISADESSSQFTKAIEADILSLQCYGMILKDTSISGLMDQSDNGILPTNILDDLPPSEHGYTSFVMQLLCIASAFHAHGDSTRAVRWLQSAQWVEAKSMGTDLDFFMTRYGMFMKHSGVYELAKANKKT